MKCEYCKKSHLEFKCQCEKVFCIHCRLPEIHKCQDFKAGSVVVVGAEAPPKVAKL